VAKWRLPVWFGDGIDAFYWREIAVRSPDGASALGFRRMILDEGLAVHSEGKSLPHRLRLRHNSDIFLRLP